MGRSESDHSAQAAQLYESGDDAALLDLARSVWQASHGEPRPAGVAETCRFAMLACIRLERKASATAGPTGPFFAQRHVWEAHAMTAATLAREQHSIAGLLLPRVFRLIESGAHREARDVIDDMVRLIEDSADYSPHPTLLRRLCHEKRGYSYFVEGLFAEASASYREALSYATTGSRGELKVRGGLALANFMASDRTQSDLDALRDALTAVALAAEEAGYPDTGESARQNLALISAGESDGWVPFELV